MAMTSKGASSSNPTSTGGAAYLATQSIFVAIATLLVVVRIYVRSFVVRKFGLDDAVVVLALVGDLPTT